MITHKGTRTIRTGRLHLRRFALSDASAMHATWASDPRVTQYLSWEPHQSIGMTKMILKGWCALYENPAYYHWVIEYEGRIVGAISVVRQSDKNEFAELGYCLGYDYWGHGIAAEAADAVMGYLFSEVGMQRVEIRHAAGNLASGRVAEKCGMTPEGTLRRAARTGTGEFTDICVWGILHEEWETKDNHAN